MKERLRIAALTFAVVAVVLGVVSIALAWSLPYRIAAENLLTNGTVIPGGRLSKYIDGGFDSLECVKHGNYTVNAIGIEPRCSVHGSMSEMEAGWKKEIH